MKNAYVVRELVSVAFGEKELRTRYEYGTFRSYDAANHNYTHYGSMSVSPFQHELSGYLWESVI